MLPGEPHPCHRQRLPSRRHASMLTVFYGGSVRSVCVAVVVVAATLASLATVVGAHGSYSVCSLYHCTCSNVTGGSLECVDGHDLTVRGLLQLPRTYERVAIDGFLVADVLDGGELSAFERLRSLRLTRCRIERVGDGALAGLGQLQELSLAGNHISRLGAGALRDVSGSLVTLDLSSNLLRALDAGLLDGFAQLRELDLGGNRLRALPHDALDSLVALHRLDLSANELAYVFPRTFAALGSLTYLNLQRNLLVTVQAGVLAGKPLLRDALFGGNRLECNCGTQWLRDRLLAEAAAAVAQTTAGASAQAATTAAPAADATAAGRSPPTPQQQQAFNGSSSSSSAAAAVLPTLCMADGAPLVSKTDADLRCTEPLIEAVSAPLRTFQRNAFRLFCNATGHPPPAVVWRLPCGDYLADPAHGEWLHDAMHAFFGSRTYYITATADELAFSVEPAAHGSELHVSSLRRFSEGTYVCFAVNPAGNVSADVVVTMVAPIGDVYAPSLIYGAGAASAGTLLAGVLGCLVQKARRSRRKRRCRKRAAATVAARGSQRASLLGSTGSGGDGSADGDAAGSRRESGDAPLAAAALEAEPGPSDALLRAKASTSGDGGRGCSSDEDTDGDDDEYEEEDDAVEGSSGEDDYASEYASEEDEAAESYDAFAVSTAEGSPRRHGARTSAVRTRETLGAVKGKLRSRVDRMDTMKEKLRLNMERKAERVKVQMEKRAERMRTNMEKHRERMRDTLINIRESTSHSLQSIRDTSSSYAHKLHVGMRNAMENVGYTVQSLKELCGAGDLGLTMSVATIATNVDTEEQVEVIRNVTLV